jgi:hypothetical protein
MRRESDDDAAIRKYGIPASTVADALMQAMALKQVSSESISQKKRDEPVRKSNDQTDITR